MVLVVSLYEDHQFKFCLHSSFLPTASSVSQFQLNANDLLVGDNIISLTFISASGANVTRIFTIRKTLTQVTFSPSCGYTFQTGGNVVFSCSQGSGTQSIRTIRYSINGGQEVTGEWKYFKELVCTVESLSNGSIYRLYSLYIALSLEVKTASKCCVLANNYTYTFTGASCTLLRNVHCA